MSQHEPGYAEKSVSNILDNGFFRATTVVCMLVFAVTCAYQAGIYFQENRSAFDRLNAKLETIELKLESNTRDRWHKTDMIQFCRETELKNPGWKCGELD